MYRLVVGHTHNEADELFKNVSAITSKCHLPYLSTLNHESRKLKHAKTKVLCVEGSLFAADCGRAGKKGFYGLENFAPSELHRIELTYRREGVEVCCVAHQTIAPQP